MQTAIAAFDIEVFYDGACPVCLREMRMLQGRDREQRIRFVDIASEGFDSASVGLTLATLMDRIHGRLPDGTMVEGVEVFRRLYAAVGFGRLVALTRLPGIRQLLDLAYQAFARNRLRLTGRCADRACELKKKPVARQAAQAHSAALSAADHHRTHRFGHRHAPAGAEYAASPATAAAADARHHRSRHKP